MPHIASKKSPRLHGVIKYIVKKDLTFSRGGIVVLQMEKQVIQGEITASRRF